MDKAEFIRLLRDRLQPGLVMKNPGKGTSTIIWIDDDRICYRRGDSKLYANLSDLWDAYARFAGKQITTNDLKLFRPGTFKKGGKGHKGHDCNSTFFFMALGQTGLVNGPPTGRPFGATLTPLS